MNLSLPHAPITAISGPSGSGKTTLIKLLLTMKPYLTYGQSFTTRSARTSDWPGKYVYGTSLDAICDAVTKGQALEWASFAGNAYATCRPDPMQPTIIDLEVQGAAQLMAYFGSLPITFIGIIPHPNFQDTNRTTAAEFASQFESNAGVRQLQYKRILKAQLEKRGDLDPQKLIERVSIGELEIATITSRWATRSDTHVIRNIHGSIEDTASQAAKLIQKAYSDWKDECGQVQDGAIRALFDQIGSELDPPTLDLVDQHD
ncbi:MAG: ATP-binding cassette domain-containing protein [bacterium]